MKLPVEIAEAIETLHEYCIGFEKCKECPLNNLEYGCEVSAQTPDDWKAYILDKVD